jgi:hypothetical protein
MTQPGRATYHYSVDSDDRIVSVSSTWLAFALENGAPELTSDRLLGEPIWSFVSGPQVVEIYTLLFEWVRTSHARISVPFRCDSPNELRFMRLHLAPSEAAGVEMAAIVERVFSRPAIHLLERLASRADYSFEICSFCRRIFAFGAWLELEEAISRLAWLETERPPQLEEVVCESCERSSRRRGIEGAGA